MRGIRKLAIALLAVGVVVATVYATGAFTSMTASRSADVRVAGDGSAFLSLQPSNGPNGVYASYGPTGALQVSIGGATGSTASGVNPDAVTVFKNVFTITNKGSQSVSIWFAGDSEAVTFVGPSGRSIETETNARTLRPGGRSLHVGLIVDARGVEPGANLLKSVTVHADTEVVNAPIQSGTDTDSNSGIGSESRIGDGSESTVPPERNGPTLVQKRGRTDGDPSSETDTGGEPAPPPIAGPYGPSRGPAPSPGSGGESGSSVTASPSPASPERATRTPVQDRSIGPPTAASQPTPTETTGPSVFTPDVPRHAPTPVETPESSTAGATPTPHHVPTPPADRRRITPPQCRPPIHSSEGSTPDSCSESSSGDIDVTDVTKAGAPAVGFAVADGIPGDVIIALAGIGVAAAVVAVVFDDSGGVSVEIAAKYYLNGRSPEIDGPIYLPSGTYEAPGPAGNGQSFGKEQIVRRFPGITDGNVEETVNQILRTPSAVHHHGAYTVVIGDNPYGPGQVGLWILGGTIIAATGVNIYNPQGLDEEVILRDEKYKEHIKGREDHLTKDEIKRVVENADEVYKNDQGLYMWVLYENGVAKIVRAKDLSQTAANRDTIEIGTAFSAQDGQDYVDKFANRHDMHRITNDKET